MSRICQNCNKQVMVGRQVARARQELLYRSPKAYKPNLHTYKAPAQALKGFGIVSRQKGERLKLTLCTKCLRMMKEYVAGQVSSVSAAAS